MKFLLFLLTLLVPALVSATLTTGDGPGETGHNKMVRRMPDPAVPVQSQAPPDNSPPGLVTR
ncbi:hypothetical protein IAQ61_004805 [Plenodomus lingam]|uniref:Predicted protein n=1 Tax=Leptosphaeria maculans (strain JN3 / isolate v23.1.3 / race Av1-4-5-6-7-8) TaxID=985895 RepID=E4ZWK5_LEPMJ|nr:predicted protein [Plenodomus lingam JN3]KAH9874176.1 hypothetical protein IAQ61_004805 [Plenodomus lingam]CBX95981.1 predicted protein [Plenodomus lingam JN3]